MLNGALPDFTLDGGLALAVARGVAVGALLILFGAAAFRSAILPHDAPASVRQAIGRILRRAAMVGAVGELAWFVLETRSMAGTLAPADFITVLGTDFGRLLASQFVLTLMAGWAPPRWALIPALLALLLQTGHSHAASMYDGFSLLLVSDGLHLLAAGLWLGGLLPLWCTVRAGSAAIAGAASRRFSPLALACVVALAGTALFQGSVLIASLPALVGTAYGLAALGKLALFAGLLVCAAINRFRFTPRLLAGADAARRGLAVSIAVETGLAVLLVLLAAMLSALPPGMHTQTVWPFTQRLTFDTVNEDPAFRREVLIAALALGGGVLLILLGSAALRGWRRIPPIVAGLVIAWFAIPHFDLLLADAGPTTYFNSPTDFAVGTIAGGATLFAQNCAACHGPNGEGNGPAAKGLPVPPADLTAAHLWMHSDGELFGWLTDGIPAPEGGPAMPGFAGVLSPDQRWALIDYIRGHNGGLVVHRTRQWSPPLQAPGFELDCGHGTQSLADLRGHDVRLVFGAADAVTGVVTVMAAADGPPSPSPTRCVTNDETVAAAYAIVAGLPAAAIGGTEFLIDAQGWLRAMQASGTTPGWNDGRTLAAALQDIHDHPIAAAHAPMDMPM